ncbi:MAG: hypothetical protein ACLSAF_06565 [Intestinimonas sp.]
MRAQTKLQSLVTAAILAAAITIMTAFSSMCPSGPRAAMSTSATR